MPLPFLILLCIALLSPTARAQAPATPTDLEECTRRLGSSREDMALCQQRRDEAGQQTVALQARIRKLHAQLNEARERNASLTREVADLSRALESADAELARSADQLTQILGRLEEANSVDAALRATLTQLEAERAEMETQVSKARHLRQELEALDARLEQEEGAAPDEELRKALTLARDKAELRVLAAEQKLEQMTARVEELEEQAAAASARSTELAHELSERSETLVRTEATITHQRFLIALLVAVGIGYLVFAGWRQRRGHGDDVERAWRLTRPLVTDGGQRLGPIQLMALKELIEAREAVARNRALGRAAMRMLIATGGATVAVVIAYNAWEGIAATFAQWQELIAGNFLTFAIGTGGPLGVVATLSKSANDRLRASIDTADKLGVPDALRAALADRPDYVQHIDQLWYWPDATPEELAAREPAPPVDGDPVDSHPVV